MHEFSIARSLITQCERIATENGCSRLSRVKVKIGALSGVETELLNGAFRELSRETVADGATLSIETGKIVFRCGSCETFFEDETYPAPCPACDSTDTVPEGGNELLLVSVDLVR